MKIRALWMDGSDGETGTLLKIHFNDRLIFDSVFYRRESPAVTKIEFMENKIIIHGTDGDGREADLLWLKPKSPLEKKIRLKDDQAIGNTYVGRAIYLGRKIALPITDTAIAALGKLNSQEPCSMCLRGKEQRDKHGELMEQADQIYPPVDKEKIRELSKSEIREIRY